MMNDIKLMGRMTRDPEIRTVGNTKVVAFRIAVEDDYKKDAGGKKETDFFDCAAWGPLADVVGKYCRKGRTVVVSGKMKNKNWTDKDGNKHYAMEVVCDNIYFCDSAKKNDEQNINQGSYQQNAATPGPAYGGGNTVPDQGGYSGAAPQNPGGYPQNNGQPAAPAPQGGQGDYNQPAQPNGNPQYVDQPTMRNATNASQPSGGRSYNRGGRGHSGGYNPIGSGNSQPSGGRYSGGNLPF